MMHVKSCPHCAGPMTQRYTKAGQKRGWNCPACANERAKNRRINAPEQWLDSKLWTFYRIRLADYRRMVESQGGRCAACRRLPEGTGGVDGTGLVIDHDHACCPSTRQAGRVCGKCVRGLLCQHCNVALGMVDDDLDRLEMLAGYIRRTRGEVH